jgi:branched-chain amino acid transport system substrate-binding protein
LRVRRKAAFGCLVGLSAVGIAACGGDSGGGGGKAEGSTLTIYSSLPKQGSSRPQSIAIENGAKLALRRVGGKVGKYKIVYKQLDDASAQAGQWDAGPTSANARKAAQDKSTIAYLGEYNSGASAISIPILNEGGIPQVSPANTAVGLTTDEAGAQKGEPGKYYTTGKRTYARVVPRDSIQGAALATVMKEDGCKDVSIVNDKQVYGAGLARDTTSSLEAQGIKVLGNDGYDPKAPNYRSLAQKIKGKNPDCLFESAVQDSNGIQMTKDLLAANPSARLYGPDGLAISTYTNPKEGGIPASLAPRVKLTVGTLSPDQYPPEGKQFYRDYKTTYHAGHPDPYAIYGYECMSLVLDAIKRAGAKGNDRNEVIKQIFATRNRKSVLGTYSIDKNGDSTITDIGLYRIKGGQLTFIKTIKPAGKPR